MLNKCKSKVINDFTKFIKNIRIMFRLNKEQMLAEFDKTIKTYLKDKKLTFSSYYINNGTYVTFKNNNSFKIKYEILYHDTSEKIPFHMYIENIDGEVTITFDLECKNVKADAIIEIGQLMQVMQKMPKHDFTYLAKFTK